MLSRQVFGSSIKAFGEMQTNLPTRSARAEFDAQAYASEFKRDGYFIWENVLDDDSIARLSKEISGLPKGAEVRRKRNVYGVRNLLEICPAVAELSADPCIRQFVTPVLGCDAFAVRAIFFDKAPGANWSLFWHQDNVISVRERIEAPGFVGWSQKAGVWQVQPPAEILAQMIAIRVHLDPSVLDNGPLRVRPGSHQCGWIDDIDEWKARVPEIICTVGSGGVVAMCPLTLHASSQSESTCHRRVIHIEYAKGELPYGLVWNNRIVAT
jgi:ectoine hydroxylase-related dioxygenase (phytanoyl-CoA dioxygenase family)